MSLVALLEVRLKADSLDESYAAVSATLADTRKFPGCQGAEVLIDTDDPAHLVVVETWESAEHDAAYREWRAGEGAPTELARVLAGRPVLTKFVASDTI